MWLELSVVSYHRLSPRLKTVMRFEASGGSIGRSEQASWQLADPERIVSGLHATVGSDGQGFYIEDLSTNGLFINNSSDLIGKGNRRYLKQGDTLLLGDYELQVSGIELRQTIGSTAAPGHVWHDEVAAVGEPLSVVSSRTDFHGVMMSEADPLVSPGSHDAVDSQLDDFFHVQPLIPDDWSNDIGQQPSSSEQSADDAFSAVTIPMDVAAAGMPKADDAFSISEQKKIQAFLQGLQLTPEQMKLLNQSEQSWQLLGEALRASLDGLMAMMRARSKVKNTLRVNQTTFQARENNPLKFSASFEDVFHTLFASSNTGFLTPKQAVHSAFQDMSKHEVALLDASRAAMQAMLSRISPESIRRKDVGSGVLDKLSSVHAKARHWAIYELYHQELTEQLAKNTQRGFSDDFIDAYEQSIKSVE
ncbi:type VI secretion system-associated FHA domain protein TagH [Alkalimonas sp. MEB108]|uniref:Type VI secretion system-associated FHA domain protein TagH n=1 Tax=Alkalimonas cellulosilytica TaxID=3058395 RepID=A0ABU7J2A0_9GAMM|nr:type VI secretion system-associated FHA domain protein TagH [Alkalimonas sp. MEB108]MEE2000641.1 type VI secretion system-associated FHA domain protein TagH [Alkalimonas sp. MEB108]